MTDATHTPGPWELHDATGKISWGNVHWSSPPEVPGGYIIASHGIFGPPQYRPPTPRERANARLIAAAPELLAALQAVADYWAGGDVPADIDAAMRAAIAKATGQ